MLTTKLYRITYDPVTFALVRSDLITDPDVENTSDLEKMVERDVGQFRIGTLSVTISDLDETYFEEAGDPNAPFVFQVEDDDFLFHGPIDAATINYDADTQVTTFTVTSWEIFLANANLPARTVWEGSAIESASPVAGDDDIRYVKMRADSPVAPGDILQWDADTGDVRAFIFEVTIDGDGHKIAGFKQPPPVNVADVEDDTMRGENDANDELFIYSTNHRLRTSLREMFPENVATPNPDYETWRAGENDNVRIRVYTASGVYDWRRIISIDYWTGKNDVAPYGSYPWSFVIHVDEKIDSLDIDPEIERVRISAYVSTQVSEFRLYGREMYGYDPGIDLGSPFSGVLYDVETMIDAMMQVGRNGDPSLGERRPLGIFANVYDSIVNTDSFDQELFRWAELPDNPLDALRELQRTFHFWLRFEPTLDDAGTVDEVPRLEVHIIPVESIETAVPVETENIVTKFTYNPSETGKVRAVVVKANNDYFKPKREADWIGVWFNEADLTPYTLTEEELAYTLVPTGKGVVELEVLITPGYDPTLPAFRGTRRPQYLDPQLTQLAQHYYEFLNEATRQFSGELAERNDSLLGRFVTFTEVDPQTSETILEKTVFVSRASVSIDSADPFTSLSGYVVPATPPPATSLPSAKIVGPLDTEDADNNGSEVVDFTSNSTGHNITYAWHHREVGDVTWLDAGTDPEYTATLAVGNHEIRLVVTDDNANTDEDIVVARVRAQGIVIADPPPVDLESDFIILGDHERTDLGATPDAGTVIYDGDGATMGLNLKYAGGWAQIWDSTNDGDGSGLDADALDGQHGSYYTNASNLSSGTLDMARIADGSVTNAKLASGIDASKLTTGTLPIARIADGDITDAKLASGIDASKLTTGTLPIARIADGAVTDAKLASGIDASKLTTGTLPIARIADGAVTNAKLASGIDASKVTTGTLPDGQLSSNVPLKNAANTFSALQSITNGGLNVTATAGIQAQGTSIFISTGLKVWQLTVNSTSGNLQGRYSSNGGSSYGSYKDIVVP